MVQPPLLPKPSGKDPTAQSIVVDNASFAWEASAQPMLNNISLTARCPLRSPFQKIRPERDSEHSAAQCTVVDRAACAWGASAQPMLSQSALLPWGTGFRQRILGFLFCLLLTHLPFQSLGVWQAWGAGHADGRGGLQHKYPVFIFFVDMVENGLQTP